MIAVIIILLCVIIGLMATCVWLHDELKLAREEREDASAEAIILRGRLREYGKVHQPWN